MKSYKNDYLCKSWIVLKNSSIYLVGFKEMTLDLFMETPKKSELLF